MSVQKAVAIEEDDLDLENVEGEDEPGAPLVTGKQIGTVTSKALWKTFRSNSELLEYAAEVAADMALGLYVDGQGRLWAPRRPIIRELMRHLGYGKVYILNNHRPAWWPDRGTQAFFEYVDLKVSLRRQSGLVRFEQIRPYMEALVGMSVVELTRRMRLEPETVATRDITDIMSRTSKHLTFGASEQPPVKPAGGNVYLTLIQQAEAALPEGSTAREQMRKLFDAHITDASKAIALPVIDLVVPQPRTTRSHGLSTAVRPAARKNPNAKVAEVPSGA